MPNISSPSSVASAVATGGATARVRLPLELNGEVTAADGSRYRWGPNENPRSRVKGLSFGTKIGEGFSQASGQLPREFLMDYPDQSLIDTVTFYGADGTVAYEGRVQALPRDLTAEGSSVGVTLAGWMAHTTDQKFTEVYVDRDLSAWKGPALTRQAFVLSNNYNITAAQQASDVATATSGIVTGWDGPWASPFLPVSEAWYDIGPGLTISRIDYSWVRQAGGVDPANPSFAWSVNVAADDNALAITGTGNLRAAGPVASSFQPGARYRFGILSLSYVATPAGSDGQHFGVSWYNLAVYGNHGLTLRSGETGQPPGVYGSDVIRNVVSRFCPKLNTSGVSDQTYVIQHLAFKDPTTPFDALQQINKYHLFNLAVWEDKTLYWEPFDLTDYDWQVRTTDPGVTIQQQGPSVDTTSNGITVSYTDVLSGAKGYLTPTTNPELLNTDLTNPWNLHGIPRQEDLPLTFPSTAADAVQAGRAALADRNRSKHPGQITVQGYIQDRAGNELPGWRPRAGETVAITDHPYDAPRLIHETSWDDESKTLTLTVDGPPSLLDAQLERVTNALTARGLA
jgi:hypothetical protein